MCFHAFCPDFDLGILCMPIFCRVECVMSDLISAMQEFYDCPRMWLNYNLATSQETFENRVGPGCGVLGSPTALLYILGRCLNPVDIDDMLSLFLFANIDGTVPDLFVGPLCGYKSSKHRALYLEQKSRAGENYEICSPCLIP